LTASGDSSNVVVRPPIAWAIAAVAGLVLDRVSPLPWLPADWPNAWFGAAIFTLGLALLMSAALTFRKAGTEVQTSQPTTVIVAHGPYRFSRNPIYLGMFIGLAGLAVGFDTGWILVALIPFYFVLRYGVVAREEAYLERKFGRVYLDYKDRVRRWV
jgi:protein-S-isoprenylcysteine O-methyltransferase Ste14